MLADLTRYPAMKDSGVPWLGSVPEGWRVLPAIAVYRPKQVRNTGMVERAVLSLSYGRIVVRPPDKLRGLVPESFETYQIVEPGNIIVRTTDLQNDQSSLRIGHSRHRGIITSAYLCLDTTAQVANEFGYQFLNAYDLLKIIYGFGSGLRQNLDYRDIKWMPVLVPPLPEQRAIVRFLRHADDRIRRYIRAKQRLIELLKEQRQATIHHAVTRGLHPDVRLKPSGVSWLCEVPEHWEVVPLRRRWTVTDCKHLTVPFVDDGHPLASVREAQTFDLSLTTARRTTPEWFAVLRQGDRAPRRGDLIYCRNVSVGAAAYVNTDDPLAMGQDVCLIRSSDQNQRYLNYFIHSPAMDRQLALLMVGSTFDRINIPDIKRLVIAVPPRTEQDALALNLDGRLVALDLGLMKAHRAIGLLREFRIRLIADVVTGKLDVREAAARLHDATETTEGIDISDTSAEVENDREDAELAIATDEATE